MHHVSSVVLSDSGFSVVGVRSSSSAIRALYTTSIRPEFRNNVADTFLTTNKAVGTTYGDAHTVTLREMLGRARKAGVDVAHRPRIRSS